MCYTTLNAQQQARADEAVSKCKHRGFPCHRMRRPRQTPSFKALCDDDLTFGRRLCPAQPNNGLRHHLQHVANVFASRLGAPGTLFAPCRPPEPRQTLGHIKHQRPIVSRGTKDKKPGDCRCVGSICSEQIHSSPVTPARCLTRFLLPIAFFSRLTAAFQQGTSHLLQHQSIIEASLRTACRHKIIPTKATVDHRYWTKTNHSQKENVLPQVHPLPQVRHACSTPHPHLPEERGRGHLASHLLRELQSRPRQRERSLSVLPTCGQGQGSRCCSTGRFNKSSSVPQPGEHRDSIGDLKSARLSRPRQVPADLGPFMINFTSCRFGPSVQRSLNQPYIDPASSWETLGSN